MTTAYDRDAHDMLVQPLFLQSIIF